MRVGVDRYFDWIHVRRYGWLYNGVEGAALTKLTKSEEAELHDAKARLKRPWQGYTYSGYEALYKIILRLTKRAK